ncbi:MFS transporter [Aquibacillus rhizosphaerae]|uniref:Uncharacterized protein n=1 Tax=Aquibacillus rhizosphaerae TaxID=3051431 RepID=A0ABT7L294_9BACI|nr:hypothetical protein [Aquibacillus sp. LR5S19]MDL4839953.1 hypothetical protein [Aquibacillus sp. LR5S19]
MKIIKRFYWILPLLLIVGNISLLFFQNLTEVTEPPAENWSRDLTIGETNINNYPLISLNNEGNVELIEIAKDSLRQKTYNESFEVIEEKQLADIPVNKWTQIFMQEDTLLYFDYHHIYDASSKKIVTDVDKFYPLDNSLLYLIDNQLFYLDPITTESSLITTLENKFDKLVPISTEQGIKILTYYRENEELLVSVYNIIDFEAERTYQESFTVPFNEEIREIAFAYDDDKFSFLFNTEIKATNANQPIHTTYLYESSKATLEKITLNDPKGMGELEGINDMSVTYEDQKLKLLFSATGRTNTKYREAFAFNIYEAILSNENFDIYRRSNTAYLSAKPQWVSPNIISWIEIDSEANPISISSNESALINKTQGVNANDLISGLGKTIGMLSVSFLATLLATMWVIGPIFILVILYITKRSLLDRDLNWVFHLGLVSYVISFLLFKDSFFIDNIYTYAPDYLTFTGSSYVYLFVFGAIAYFCSKQAAKQNDWGIFIKLFYLIAIHILLLSVFFGPYFM